MRVETVAESVPSTQAEDVVTGDDGQIVVVRPRVLDDVGHVLGNMFQRIFHLVERTGDRDTVIAADLESSLRRLEAFLQLLMDYVSPLSLSLQPVSLSDVAQSLAQQISAASGRPVTLTGSVPADAQFLGDAGRLSQAFGLLALQLRAAAGGNEAIEIRAATNSPSRVLALAVSLPPACIVERSSECEIQWSLAEKLLDIHGGVLRQGSTRAGGVLWEIMLPLQP
jgi:signal transduction histidine kinase